MKIKCYGSRGSIPVSGSEYLKYGGDTTCILVEASSGHNVILDAGSGIRTLGNILLKESHGELSICFTHGHWDHVLGLPFFKPLYSDRFHLDIFGVTLGGGMNIQTTIQGIFAHPYFPIGIDAIKATLHYHPIQVKPFNIGSLWLTPFFLNHPDGGVGYRIEEEGTSFDKTIQLGLDAGVKRLGLFHHNQDRTDAEVDDMVKMASDIILSGGANLPCIGIDSGFEMTF